MVGNLRILLVEDNLGDASLLREELGQAASSLFDLVHEVRLADGLRRLQEGPFDALLLDLNLPDSTGPDSVALIRAAAPQTPVVVLTGMGDVALGVEAVRKGAQDYLVKGQAAGPLLSRVILFSVERKRMENEREQLVRQLQEALAKVRTLSGLLPICAWCKKIRDDEGYWTHLETYIRDHSEADFTHSICPECLRKRFPDCTEDAHTAPDGG